MCKVVVSLPVIKMKTGEAGSLGTFISRHHTHITHNTITGEGMLWFNCTDIFVSFAV